MKLSIATFNCEWRRAASTDGRSIRERVFAGDIDVVCLTETHSDFLQDVGGFTIASRPPVSGPGMKSRRKVLLWSRKPWRSVDIDGPEGIPAGRYAAGVTDTPAGELQITGVVIPYSFAGVRYGEPRRSPWELHLAYLRALDRALPQSPTRTIILGDLNQRFPRKYQPALVHDELERVILSRFELATRGVLEPIGQQAIDHICVSRDLSWSLTSTIGNERPGGGKISDHFGARTEVSPLAP